MIETTTKTHLAHGIEKTEYLAQYDDSVKELLSDKQVLAWIAQYRIEEFKDYDIPAIMDCIEGEPEVSTVSVHPGKNKTHAITGMNSESKQTNEGEVTFDIRFYMVTPDHERIKVIVNVEAQKAYYPGYAFEPRAIVYCARMISEQIDREFTTDGYDGLKKVYSIWIFFNAPEKDSDTITEYGIIKRDIYGKSVEGGKYDYLSISFIRLPHGEKEESKHKLIDMLATLFSEKMDANTKKEHLQQKHQMVMMRDLEGGIHTMCNVGEGVWERAEAAGEKKGELKGRKERRLEGISALVKSLRKFGATDEQIVAQMMEELGLTEAEAKEYFDKVN